MVVHIPLGGDLSAAAESGRGLNFFKSGGGIECSLTTFRFLLLSTPVSLSRCWIPKNRFANNQSQPMSSDNHDSSRFTTDLLGVRSLGSRA